MLVAVNCPFPKFLKFNVATPEPEKLNKTCPLDACPRREPLALNGAVRVTKGSSVIGISTLPPLNPILPVPTTCGNIGKIGVVTNVNSVPFTLIEPDTSPNVQKPLCADSERVLPALQPNIHGMDPPPKPGMLSPLAATLKPSPSNCITVIRKPEELVTVAIPAVITSALAETESNIITKEVRISRRYM